jgi:hypothetical protein
MQRKLYRLLGDFDNTSGCFLIVFFLVFLRYCLMEAMRHSTIIQALVFLPTTTLDSIFCHSYVALFYAGLFFTKLSTTFFP